MSKVFVVTPAYCTEENRRLPLLLQTIYWVQQQTHKDYLHIVVDDESTDSTPEVLERLSQSNTNLKVFRKKNGGSSAAINYGVEQALALDKPDYITVCHSDDVLLPESLDVRVKLASKSGAELVYTADPLLQHLRLYVYSVMQSLSQILQADNSISTLEDATAAADSAFHSSLEWVRSTNSIREAGPDCWTRLYEPAYQPFL